jgi:hypothetical protein
MRLNQIFAVAAFALIAGAGTVSAQETDFATPPRNAHTRSIRQKLAQFKTQQAFGIHTTSAPSRNVGPSSTVDNNPDSFLGSANSGLPANSRAPSAGNVSGGN